MTLLPFISSTKRCGFLHITRPIWAAGTQINTSTHCCLCCLWLKSSSGWIAPCCCKHWGYFEIPSWQISYSIFGFLHKKSCSFCCEILARSEWVPVTQGGFALCERVVNNRLNSTKTTWSVSVGYNGLFHSAGFSEFLLNSDAGKTATFSFSRSFGFNFKWVSHRFPLKLRSDWVSLDMNSTRNQKALFSESPAGRLFIQGNNVGLQLLLSSHLTNISAKQQLKTLQTGFPLGPETVAHEGWSPAHM